MTQRPLRVGVIGASWSLVGHLPAWRNLPGVEIAAICTAHEETARKAAAAHGIAKSYWDYRKLAEDPEIDIIDVGTRPSLRYDMVMSALAAGKHVLNANPFAVTLDQARTMLAKQREAGTIGMVEAQFQYLPQFTRMKELIDEGFLGELFGVSVRCHFPLVVDGSSVFPFVTRPGYTDTYTWLSEAKSGASALRNLGGHCLHGLIYLFGDIASVSGELDTFVETWRYPEGREIVPDTADTAMLTLRFAKGGIGQLNVSYVVADAGGFALEAFGSRGRFRLQSTSGFPDAHNTQLFVAPAAPRGMTGQLEREESLPPRLSMLDGAPIPMPPGARVVVPLTRLFGAMAEAIRSGGATPQPSFAQACRVHESVEAAERAAREGRVQSLAPA